MRSVWRIALLAAASILLVAHVRAAQVVSKSSCTLASPCAWNSGSSWRDGNVPTSTDDVVLESGSAYTITDPNLQIGSLNMTALTGATTRIQFNGNNCPSLTVGNGAFQSFAYGTGQVELRTTNTYDCGNGATAAAFEVGAIPFEVVGALVLTGNSAVGASGVFLVNHAASSVQLTMNQGSSITLSGTSQLSVQQGDVVCVAAPCTINVNSNSARDTSTPLNVPLALQSPQSAVGAGLTVVLSVSQSIYADNTGPGTFAGTLSIVSGAVVMCTGTNYWTNVQVTSGQFHLSSTCFLQPSGTTTIASGGAVYLHDSTLASTHTVSGTGLLNGPGAAETAVVEAPATRTISNWAGTILVQCALSSVL